MFTNFTKYFTTGGICLIVGAIIMFFCMKSCNKPTAPIIVSTVNSVAIKDSADHLVKTIQAKADSIQVQDSIHQAKVTSLEAQLFTSKLNKQELVKPLKAHIADTNEIDAYVNNTETGDSLYENIVKDLSTSLIQKDSQVEAQKIVIDTLHAYTNTLASSNLQNITAYNTDLAKKDAHIKKLKTGNLLLKIAGGIVIILALIK